MTRDQFLAEMMGKCWHTPDETGARNAGNFICKKCGWVFWDNHVFPSFSTSPADILELQQFVLAQKWWDAFYGKLFLRWNKEAVSKLEPDSAYVTWLFSSPDRFATLVAEFRGYKGKGE